MKWVTLLLRLRCLAYFLGDDTAQNFVKAEELFLKLMTKACFGLHVGFL